MFVFPFGGSGTLGDLAAARKLQLEQAARFRSHPARSNFCGRIVYAENRFPLFRTMLYRPSSMSRMRAARSA
jgi:hypothetical protein